MNPAVGISISLFAALTLNSSSRTGTDKSKLLFDSRADSVAIVRTVSRFHSALERGDTTTVKNLLARDVRVLEGGEAETREQYLAHHLAADIEFAKAVSGQRTLISYTREGNVAWVISTSTSTGSFRGRDINSIGAELIILSRTTKGWQIRAIHWSSARRPS
jgi:ketosteroid isomerase-like protein